MKSDTIRILAFRSKSYYNIFGWMKGRKGEKERGKERRRKEGRGEEGREEGGRKEARREAGRKGGNMAGNFSQTKLPQNILCL